jgi:hypothetical protein
VVAPGVERIGEDAHRSGASLRGLQQRLRGLRLDGVELQLNRQPVVFDWVKIALARQRELRLDGRARALRPGTTVAGWAGVLGDESVRKPRYELVVQRLALHPPPRLEQRRELEPRLKLREREHLAGGSGAHRPACRGPSDLHQLLHIVVHLVIGVDACHDTAGREHGDRRLLDSLFSLSRWANV